MPDQDTFTLYVTIPLTLRVIDPGRVADAAKLSAYEHPFDAASLDLMATDAFRERSISLQAAAATPVVHAVARGFQSGFSVPGANLTRIGHVNLSYVPPTKPAA